MYINNYNLRRVKGMKKWNNPKLWSLGVWNTTEEVTPLHAFGKHYCHRQSEIHNGNCEAGSGHSPVNLGDCIEHITGTPNHPEYSCCCKDFEDLLS